MTASGEAMRKLPAHSELERWYRCLLWAYPVGYRRAYGEEILAMLMDSAEPGRRRPARADVADLARGAVRQWFRLPVGPSAVVAAVLAAVVLGAVGAAAGSWAAWRTNELPSDTEFLRTVETVAGTPLTAAHVGRSDGPRELAPGASVSTEQRFPNWTTEAAQERLRADGWTLVHADRSDKVYRFSGSEGRADELYPGAVSHELTLTRGGHLIRIMAVTYPASGPEVAGTYLDTVIRTIGPSWQPAPALLGLLVGAVTGWLLTGWATYRLRRQTLPRRFTVLALWLTALGLAAYPTIGLYSTLITYASTDAPAAYQLPETTVQVYDAQPPHHWVVREPAAELFGGTLTAGLAILIVAATPRKRTVRPTAAAT